MITRTLSFSDLALYLEDREAYYRKLTEPRQQPGTVPELVGAVVHRIASRKPEYPEAPEEQPFAEAMNRLSESERLEAEASIADKLEAIAELSARDDSSVVREKQLSWRDPVTGWKLKAKPDEIALPGASNNYMEIADLKTAYRLRKKHRDQLYFFGLVASLATGYDGPIKLVVKLLGSRTRQEFWYSPKVTAAALERVRETVVEIDAFLVSRGLLEATREQVAA
ncbi:MAG: PD-(D/E)XK nuclease family protein [Candidatus Obscuribacterales bacterium]